MPRDLSPYRVVLSIPLTAYDYGLVFCDWCARPVYDRALYGRDRLLRAEARRRHIRFARRMWVVVGLDGEQRVCPVCMVHLRLRHVSGDADA